MRAGGHGVAGPSDVREVELAEQSDAITGGPVDSAVAHPFRERGEVPGPDVAEKEVFLGALLDEHHVAATAGFAGADQIRRQTGAEGDGDFRRAVARRHAVARCLNGLAHGDRRGSGRDGLLAERGQPRIGTASGEEPPHPAHEEQEEEKSGGDFAHGANPFQPFNYQ